MTENKKAHGGARPGAGRPSSYRSEYGQWLRDYTANQAIPSLRHFAACTGLSQRQMRRWEIRHSDFAIAIGLLRIKQEIATGRAA